jgi:hypothetical protein
MKFLIPVAALAILTATSCKKTEEDPKPIDNSVLADGSTITGEITSSTKLGKGFTYILKGGVHIKSGATLTIEPGVTVKSDANEPATSYLLIEPGAKIMAEGTADQPIVFTSGKANPAHQDWGGIIICGKAPVNVAGGTAASEMGAGVTYGGTDANDNSGTLRYVRVEYTGKKQTQTKEHNGFTFEGVGAGTAVDHIAVYKGGDDGIEFFGGTVNAKYLFVYGAQDDLFDWTFGWSGKGQFWVGIQGDDVADRGMEGDNNSSNTSLSPFSFPTLSNITLVGSSSAKTGDDPATATETGKTRAMKLREGTKGKFVNMTIFNFNSGIEVEHDQTLANLEAGELTLMHSDIAGAKLFSYKKTDGTTADPSKKFDNSDTHNSTNSAGIPGYISGYVGTNGSGSVDPTTLNSWFESAPYKGAVPSSNDWTTGNWTRK